MLKKLFGTTEDVYVYTTIVTASGMTHPVSLEVSDVSARQARYYESFIEEVVRSLDDSMGYTILMPPRKYQIVLTRKSIFGGLIPYSIAVIAKQI